MGNSHSTTSRKRKHSDVFVKGNRALNSYQPPMHKTDKTTDINEPLEETLHGAARARNSVLRRMQTLPNEVSARIIGYVVQEEEQPILAMCGRDIVEKALETLGNVTINDHLFALAFDAYWRVNTIRLQLNVWGFKDADVQAYISPRLSTRTTAHIRNLELVTPVSCGSIGTGEDYRPILKLEDIDLTITALQLVSSSSPRLNTLISTLNLRNKYLWGGSKSYLRNLRGSDFKDLLEAKLIPCLRKLDVNNVALKWTGSLEDMGRMRGEEQRFVDVASLTAREAAGEVVCDTNHDDNNDLIFLLKSRKMPAWA